jgi:NAD-dependent dihydropyrimidine dehydrogenase PreA subunit
VAFIIAEPCIGTKDTACVDACPVDCIHPKKDTQYEDGRPVFEQVDQLFIDPVECIDGNARNSVESRDSRVTHSTTPFSV